MILFELCGESEAHPVYQSMALSNGERHYSFLKSAVDVSLQLTSGDMLSQTLIKAINYHAIACLHPYAGEYRPCAVHVGRRQCPAPHRVGSMMDDFVDRTNRHWDASHPVGLAAFIISRLNYIHPFINGNGRTARAAGYFALCLKMGRWLPGTIILPELLHRERDTYIAALHQSYGSLEPGETDSRFDPMIALLNALLIEQFRSWAADEGTAQ